MQGLAFNEIPSEPRHATPKSAATLHDARASSHSDMR
jgi:hypothetical protein